MSTSRTIPVWATKVVDATIKDEEFQTSTHQSANLFRIECGRIWMQRIYHAQREAWKKTVQSMLLVDTNYPTEKTSSPVVVPETEIPSWIMESYCIGVAPTENHNANTEESFPMTVVSPPPSCRLDRQAVTEAIWDYFRESDNGRCCSLWLPRLLPTLHGTLHLLARQCIQKPEQEDEVFEIQSMKHYRKHQKKRSTSMKQILLWWAARTSSYDSMVILLEDPGSYAENSVRKEFLMTLEEWRTEYGLPVQLVVVGHIAPNTLPSNAHVRYVTPCRYTWLKTFWKTLLSNSESPCPIASSDMLSQLVYRYRIEHRSLSMFMEELQLNVTYFYTPPASFVWDALELHPSFLAWFGVHGTAKKWLSLKSGASKFTALQECQQFQHQIKWWWSLQMHLLPLLMDERTIPNDFLSVLAELYHAVRECDPKAPPLPPDVGRYWNRKSADLTKTPDSELSSEQKRAQGLIYELILVVGHYLRGTTEDDAVKLSSKEQMDGMQRMLHELFEFCEERMAKLQDKWNQNNPLSKRASSSGQTIDHGPCHHRQKLVDGLMSPSKELYGLLEDRLSIPREEWLYDFGGSPEDFMRGVWSLVVLGLVQAKSKRGGNKGTTVYYEKVSVVWC